MEQISYFEHVSATEERFCIGIKRYSAAKLYVYLEQYSTKLRSPHGQPALCMNRQPKIVIIYSLNDQNETVNGNMKISSVIVGNMRKQTPACPTHLGDAQPLVVVAVEAKLHLLSFVSVEVERLVPKSLSAGLDLAFVFSVIVGFVHVKFPGPLIPLVERDLHLDNVLGLLERVRDAASVPLARPARVCLATAVPGVFGLASLRVTATIIGITLVVPIGFHVNPGPLACIDESWDR